MTCGCCCRVRWLKVGPTKAVFLFCGVMSRAYEQPQTRPSAFFEEVAEAKACDDLMDLLEAASRGRIEAQRSPGPTSVVLSLLLCNCSTISAHQRRACHISTDMMTRLTSSPDHVPGLAATSFEARQRRRSTQQQHARTRP